MSKATKKRLSAPAVAPVAVAQQQTKGSSKNLKTDPTSKQSRVIAMLQAPTGTTIATIMKATGWQQHSVRGFLAGVVRKKLKLKLDSEKVGGNRVYRIVGGSAKASGRQSKRQSA